MAEGGGNAAQIAYWNDRAAETWTSFQERIDAVFTPLTEVALAAAAPVTGESVIDIGCGCGATVLELAREVGPTGRVLGLDVSAPMVARANARIASKGLAHAHVEESDAATHGFPAAGIDLLFSRFGVMFFADPVAAFTNLRGGMKSGGRLLCAVWRPLPENTWFTIPMTAAHPFLPPPEPIDTTAPGPFGFSMPERVRGILEGAGWTDVTFTPRDVPMHTAEPGQLDAATEFATRVVGPLSRLLAVAEPEVQLRAREAVKEALRPYDGPKGITLGGAIWLVSARA
jgi:SAM-dependent methyltransferase